MNKANSIANQSVQSMFKQLTQSLFEKISMVEERSTEIALSTIYFALKETKKTFAEVFATKAYDIRIMKID
jgi:hypothetical protein